MNKIQKKLLKASKDGNFLEVTYQIYLKPIDEEEKPLLIDSIIELHNKKDIDVVSEFSHLKNGMSGINFFQMRRVFEKVLPKINAEVPSVVECVNHIIAEAGGDLTASLIVEPFIEYCKIDICRCREALDIAKNKEELFEIIPPIIIAGSCLQLAEFVKKTITLMSHSNLEIRRQAVFAIGKINYKENTSLISSALNALDKSIKQERDDALLGNALSSLYALYVLDNTLEDKIVTLIQIILKNKSEIIIHVTSNILFLNKDISPPLLDLFLDVLKYVNPKKTGTLEIIDYVLVNLLESDNIDKAISLLEYLLIKNEENISIEAFSSLSHELYKKDRKLLNMFVTRWLLSQKITLYQAVMNIVNHKYGDKIELSVDIKVIANQTEKCCFFIARKAVGWLCLSPISAISFIISLLEYLHKKDIKAITELLFYPLLLNYPNKVKDYIVNILPKQPALSKKILKNVLKKLENYHDDLKSIKELPEMLPSEAQREAYSRLFNRQFLKSYEEAESKSSILSIFPKSILLYGHKSVYHVKNGTGEQGERAETKLHKMEHICEYPSLDYLDPHRFEYTIRVLRLEEMIK